MSDLCDEQEKQQLIKLLLQQGQLRLHSAYERGLEKGESEAKVLLVWEVEQMLRTETIFPNLTNAQRYTWSLHRELGMLLFARFEDSKQAQADYQEKHNMEQPVEVNSDKPLTPLQTGAIAGKLENSAEFIQELRSSLRKAISTGESSFFTVRQVIRRTTELTETQAGQVITCWGNMPGMMQKFMIPDIGDKILQDMPTYLMLQCTRSENFADQVRRVCPTLWDEFIPQIATWLEKELAAIQLQRLSSDKLHQRDTQLVAWAAKYIYLNRSMASVIHSVPDMTTLKAYMVNWLSSSFPHVLHTAVLKELWKLRTTSLPSLADLKVSCKAIHSFTLPVKVQNTMLLITRPVLVNGVELGKIPTSELYQMIATEEAEIERLGKIENKPDRLEKELAKRTEGLKLLVKHMNAVDSNTPVEDLD